LKQSWNQTHQVLLQCFDLQEIEAATYQIIRFVHSIAISQLVVGLGFGHENIKIEAEYIKGADDNRLCI
jgi:hypothetical protein